MKSRMQAENNEMAPYSILTGHALPGGGFRTTEALHDLYIHLTDKLVHQMTGGLSVVDSSTGEKTNQRPDCVIWLDKSARPVEWLTRSLWPVLSKGEDDKVPPMPKSYFLNIDREHWVNILDSQGNGGLDVGRIDDSVIRSLRSIFVLPTQKQTGLSPKIDSAKTVLDGKVIMVVDEVRSTGRTLDYAQELIAKAFPTTKVGGAYWMGGVSTGKNGLGMGNADTPVWYSDRSSLGRGVGDRNPAISSRSSSTTQRLGAWFLSAPHVDARGERIRDDSAERLRADIAQLAMAAMAGDVVVLPAFEREDFEDRLTRLNNGRSVGEIRLLRQSRRGSN